MDRNPYYARDGQPIDFMHWVMLFEDARYQVVRQTRVGKLLISTVWLGTNLGLSDEPLIFETMIFGGQEESYRYTSEHEALAHHDQLVAQAELLLSL